MKKNKHIETIICPECKEVQKAKVAHSIPFYTFIHTCVKCKYLIMESEWNKVEIKETKIQ